MKSFSVLFFLMLTLVLVNCSSESKKTFSDTEVLSAMSKLKGDVQDMAPYIYSPSSYADPKNKAQILKDLSQFQAHVEGAYQLKGRRAFDPARKSDPLIMYSMAELRDQVEAAGKSFEQGQFEYSRDLMKSSLQQCFFCHTEKNGDSKTASRMSEPVSGDQKSEGSTLQLLTNKEKSQYLLALREFDLAHKSLMAYFTNGEFKKDPPLEQEKILTELLLLDLRVFQSPLHLKQNLEAINHSELPPYTRSKTKSWLKSLTRWMTRSSRTNLSLPKIQQQLLPSTRISRLHLPPRNTELPTTLKSGLTQVDLIETASWLHGALATAQQSTVEKAESLFLLGLIYDRLRNEMSWNLNEYYFEDCVKTEPHSQISKACFSAWNDSVVMSNSGSAGVSLSKILEDKRERLRQLAF